MSDDVDKRHPPRLYGLVATEAPAALIFRRGPSDWFHLLKWNLEDGSLEPGVWVKKKLFPRRCDLSPDGRLMCYYLSGGIDGAYRVFAGVSRVPWLHPLVSWDEKHTWGMGYTFYEQFADPSAATPKSVAVGHRTVPIYRNSTASFVNDRRRGWHDQHYCVFEKSSSMDHVLRRTERGKSAEDEINSEATEFLLLWRGKDAMPLPDASWADWCPQGRLLVATRSGMLLMQEACDGCLRTLVEHDLTGLKPDPKPAPEWATLPLE